MDMLMEKETSMNATLDLKQYDSPYHDTLTATVKTDGNTATYTINSHDEYYGGVIHITPVAADLAIDFYGSHTIQFGDDENVLFIGDWEIEGVADSNNLDDRTTSAFDGLDDDTYRVARAIAQAVTDHYDATHANA